MAEAALSITNDGDTNVVLKTLTHNPQGTVDRGATIIVLEPGAGTAITVLDNSVVVVRENDVQDVPVQAPVAHTADEVTETVIAAGP